MKSEEVITFWMEAGPKRWFARDETFDRLLAERFGVILDQARAGTLDQWAETPEGLLALVIVLDQFSRNIHRGSPLAFAGDGKALALARRAVARGDHQQLPLQRAQWLIMPFEHAEDLTAQHEAVAHFTEMALPEMIKYAEIHRDVIARFGRFPHRNAVLGRNSTPGELDFLASGGFSA